MKQAASDIFRYIEDNPSREFVLRMSAMEIYNEVHAAHENVPRDRCHTGLGPGRGVGLKLGLGFRLSAMEIYNKVHVVHKNRV
jgi:hypothetical protein